MQDFKPEEPPPVIVPIENLGNGKISAKIASINHHGLVTIRFNDTLDMPDNVTFVHM